MASLRRADPFIFDEGGDTEHEGLPEKTWPTTWPQTDETRQWQSSLLPAVEVSSYPVQTAQDLLDSAKWGGLFGQNKPGTASQAKALQQLRMRSANNAKEWKKHADQMDILEGNHHWRETEDSDDCDMGLLRKRLEVLKRANHESDMDAMLFHLRDHLKRDLAGIGNPRLYQHSYVGTKYLIDEYAEVVKYTVDRLVKFCETTPANADKYLTIMNSAKEAYGRSALMLSGGGTLGMCHIGVVKSLLQEKLLPKIVCGSSAGSIVGAVLCTHKDNDIGGKLDELTKGDLKVFQGDDELQGWFGALVNILKGDPAFRVSNLCRVMKSLLGDITFKEAYNLTGRILNIHVSCKDKHNLPRLLNYVTAPNVVVWTAVASSCALPWVFEAPGLKAKDAATGNIEPWGHLDHSYIDGSIEGDLPAHNLERMFNVNNFIACQVNPHVQHLVQRKEGEAPNIVRKTLSVSKANVIYALDSAIENGFDMFPLKMLHSVITQKYDGDITILPDIAWVNVLKILANPDHEFMQRATKHGEQATWPKLDRIRNTVAIELALEDAARRLRVIKLDSEKDGRLRPQRAISATRSERGLSRRRTKSGGPAGFTAIPRVVRGRRTQHLPIKSMIEPAELAPPLFNLTSADNNPLSSSDEITSGHSSPCTDYEDNDFNDVTDRSGAATPGELDVSEADRRILAFLSQPVSPSISSKSFFGADNTIGHTPPPASPDMKRMFSVLHMSSINSKMPWNERRRARQQNGARPDKA